MKVQKDRWSALWRYHEKALDAGALIVAITRSQLSEWDSYHELVEERMLIQLTDLIHEFSYNARKAIELANLRSPGLIKRATKQPLHTFQSEIDLDVIDQTKVPLTKLDFWAVLGRIIHSRDADICQVTDVEVNERGRIRSTFKPCVLRFRSEKDKGDDIHFALPESLAGTYISSFSKQIEEVIQGS